MEKKNGEMEMEWGGMRNGWDRMKYWNTCMGGDGIGKQKMKGKDG